MKKTFSLQFGAIALSAVSLLALSAGSAKAYDIVNYIGGGYGVQGVDWVWEGNGDTIPYSVKQITPAPVTPVTTTSSGGAVFGGTATVTAQSPQFVIGGTPVQTGGAVFGGTATTPGTSGSVFTQTPAPVTGATAPNAITKVATADSLAKDKGIAWIDSGRSFGTDPYSGKTGQITYANYGDGSRVQFIDGEPIAEYTKSGTLVARFASTQAAADVANAAYTASSTFATAAAQQQMGYALLAVQNGWQNFQVGTDLKNTYAQLTGLDPLKVDLTDPQVVNTLKNAITQSGGDLQSIAKGLGYNNAQMVELTGWLYGSNAASSLSSYMSTQGLSPTSVVAAGNQLVNFIQNPNALGGMIEDQIKAQVTSMAENQVKGMLSQVMGVSPDALKNMSSQQLASLAGSVLGIDMKNIESQAMAQLGGALGVDLNAIKNLDANALAKMMGVDVNAIKNMKPEDIMKMAGIDLESMGGAAMDQLAAALGLDSLDALSGLDAEALLAQLDIDPSSLDMEALAGSLGVDVGDLTSYFDGGGSMTDLLGGTSGLTDGLGSIIGGGGDNSLTSFIGGSGGSSGGLGGGITSLLGGGGSSGGGLGGIFSSGGGGSGAAGSPLVPHGGGSGSGSSSASGLSASSGGGTSSGGTGGGATGLASSGGWSAPGSAVTPGATFGPSFGPSSGGDYGEIIITNHIWSDEAGGLVMADAYGNPLTGDALAAHQAKLDGIKAKQQSSGYTQALFGGGYGVQGVDWIWEGNGDTIPYSVKQINNVAPLPIENGKAVAYPGYENVLPDEPVKNTGWAVFGGTDPNAYYGYDDPGNKY